MIAGSLWNDPALGIDWGLDGITPVLSEKDCRHPLLADLPSYFEYGVGESIGDWDFGLRAVDA